MTNAASHPENDPAHAWKGRQVAHRPLASLMPYSRNARTHLGSGTSIIAAEQEGRVCLGLELSPAHCDVIVKRWEAFTGRKATHVPAQADAA